MTTMNNEDNRGWKRQQRGWEGVTALTLVEWEDLALLATTTKLALVVCVGKGGKGIKRRGRRGLKINNQPVKHKVAMILRRRGGKRGDNTTTDNKH